MNACLVSRLGFFLTYLTICRRVSATGYFYLDEICQRDSYYSSSATLKVGPTSAGYNSSGILKATKYGSYFSSWSCQLHIEPPSHHGIVVSFKEITLRTGCIDSLKLTDSHGDTAAYFCYSMEDDKEWNSFSSSGKATLTIATGRSDRSFSNNGFQLTFTAYRKGSCHSGSDFQCDNQKCISKRLTCDGHNHCGDRSDQRRCRNPLIAIIGGILGSIVFIIALVAGIIYCRSKRKKTSSSRVYPPSQSLPPQERQFPSTQPLPREMAYPPPPYVIASHTPLQQTCGMNNPYPQHQSCGMSNQYPPQPPYAMNYPHAPSPSAPPSSLPSIQSQYMEHNVSNEKDSLAYK